MALSLAAGLASSADYLIICAGQSNMDGRGAVAELTPAQQAVPPNVRYYYRPSTERPEPEKTFAHRDQFGPATMLAHRLAQARPNDTFIIVLNAKGGTALSEWVSDYEAPGVPIAAKRGAHGHLYEDMLPRIKAVRAAHPNARPLALVWLQGEADKGPLGPFYLANLKRLAANMRRDTATKDLLVVTAEPTSGAPEVFTALRDFVKGDANAALVECRSLGRTLHYDAPALLTIGERCADAVLSVIAK